MSDQIRNAPDSAAETAQAHLYSFSEARRAAEAAALAGQQHLLRYWQRLAAEHNGLPPAASLDPRAVSDVLETMLIGERIGHGLLRVRVAGRSLSSLAGTELQGLPLSLIMMPSARAQFAEAIERVFETSAPLELHLDAEGGFGRPALAARLLLLPLASPRASQVSLAGCLTALGPAVPAMRRFHLSAITPLPRFLAAAAADASAATPGADQAFAPSMPGETESARAALAKAPWLRLCPPPAGDPARDLSRAPFRQPVRLRLAWSR